MKHLNKDQNDVLNLTLLDLKKWLQYSRSLGHIDFEKNLQERSEKYDVLTGSRTTDLL